MSETDWITFVEEDPEGDLTLTHEELQDGARSMSGELYAAGWTQGEPVIVQLPNGPRAAAAYLMLANLGAVAVPMNPRDSVVFRELIANATGATHVILPETVEPLGTWPAPAVFPADTQTVVFSSGTTGEPKGICLGRHNWHMNASAVNAHHRMTKQSVHASPLPLFHCNAQGQSLWGTYYAAARYICIDGLQSDILGAVERYDVTQLSLVPTFIERLLKARPTWRPPMSLRYIISAAAPLRAETLEAVMSGWGLRVIQGYGLSESTNFSCLLPIDLDMETYRLVMLPNPSIGCPLPGVTIRVGEHDAMLVEGELQIEAPDYHCLGYLGAVAPPTRWLATGDLGYYRIIDGRRYYYLTGRVKELIMRGGEKFPPLLLEEELRALGLGGDFAVVAIPDSDLGQEIGLVSTGPVSPALLLKVPRHHRPKQVAIVESIPRTATGKVQRAKAAEAFL